MLFFFLELSCVTSFFLFFSCLFFFFFLLELHCFSSLFGVGLFSFFIFMGAAFVLLVLGLFFFLGVELCCFFFSFLFMPFFFLFSLGVALFFFFFSFRCWTFLLFLSGGCWICSSCFWSLFLVSYFLGGFDCLNKPLRNRFPIVLSRFSDRLRGTMVTQLYYTHVTDMPSSGAKYVYVT